MPKSYLNINNFGLGINNVKNPRDLKNGESANLENFNVSKNGELIPRGAFSNATNGTGVEIISNGQEVDNLTTSITAGHGLFYFESDSPLGVRGVSVNTNGTTGTISDDPDGNAKYTVCFYDNNKIFVNKDNFFRDNAAFYTSSDGIYTDVLPFKIMISGAEESSNNGTFTVVDILSLIDGAQITVESSNSHTMSSSKISAVLVLSESTLTSENVANGRQISFKAAGFVGDYALAMGRDTAGANAVDIFFESNGSWTSGAITPRPSSPGLNEGSSEFVFHYAENVLRVADGFFKEDSIPKWYGFIDRKHLAVGLGATGTTYAHEINPAFYEADNNLSTPTSANYTAEGSVNGSAEFPSSGKGWGLSVYEDSEDGDWMAGTYKFACSFIYDGNQESLLKEFDATQAISVSGKSIIINVYAKDDGTNHYANRITGGRIYIKESDTAEATSVGEPYSLLADIDITNGVRTSLDSDYQGWTLDGAGEYRITTNSTEANRGNAYWKLKLKSPNIDTYETINGYSSTLKQISFGQRGSGYKTSLIAGRRTFVANVLYDEDNSSSSNSSSDFKHYGDRIMYSEIGKFDTFPSHNYIDVVLGDGEDYVKLAYFADRILAYKQRTLQIINIASPSPSNWFLEKTVPYVGVKYPYSVCECELGVIWANRNGAYLFDGNSVNEITEGKLADKGNTVYSSSGWNAFSSSGIHTISVGYIPESKQAIFIDRVGVANHAFYYDFRYRAWYYGKYAAPNSSDSFSPLMSNFVNNSEGALITAYDTQSTNLGDAGTGKIVFTEYGSAETTHNHYVLQTADYDFGQPGLSKKVYAIYMHYRHSNSNAIDDSKIEYMINNNGTWTSFNGSTNAIVQTHSSSNNYNVVKLPLSSSAIICQSIAFKFDLTSLTEVTKFSINDIVVEYRVIRKRAA